MNNYKIFFRLIVLLLIAIELLLIFLTLFINFDKKIIVEEPFFLNKKNSFIDTLVLNMDLDEKIGQLFMLDVENVKSEEKEKIDSIIQNLHIGGISFQNSLLLNQLIVTNYLKAKSKLPLLIGSKASLINQNNCNLPIGNIINATNDSLFANEYIREFTHILKQENVNIEFSNTINILDSINLFNGFSDSDQLVMNQSSLMRELLHKHLIFSCLSFNDSLFFSSDSLAIDTLSRIQNHKFHINNYYSMQIPNKALNTIINDKANYTFSDFYKQHYGFEGLIIANANDSLSMESLRLLFNTGTDLFVGKSVEKYIDNLKHLVKSNAISLKEIDRRVKRILMAKKWALPRQRKLQSAEISFTKILNKNNILLSWKLYKNSLCLIKNNNNIIPFKNLLNNKTHVLMFGNSKFEIFRKYLHYYMDFSSRHSSKKHRINSQNIKNAENVIVLIDKNAQIEKSQIEKLKKISKNKNLIVIGFANNINQFLFADVLLFAYDNHDFSQMNMAQTLAGVVEPKGKIIPNIINKSNPPPSYSTINRLQYTIPEVAGFDQYKLAKIDELMTNAINEGATPGAQILAAKNGKVFLYKSYGFHTYSKKQKVKNSDLYDLASITKVAATTLASMKLYEKGLLNPDDSIKYLIEDTINCTIKNHKLADFFIHKTGLQADMPILKYIAYTDTAIGRYDKYYSEQPDSAHTIKLSDNYYLRTDYLDSIVASLYNLEIDTNKNYWYSDINFNIIYDILLRKIEGKYSNFIYTNIYEPLQLRYIGFLPLDRFKEKQIAPTQNDKFWRKQLLCGTPHDESAAIYGGIAGNAGLFSNANDLAILFQMLLNDGTYGGAKIFDKSTIEYFTMPQPNSKRGLGFNRKRDGSFGHTGFTGCVVWANYKTQFLFVMLSNSIHPRVQNRKFKRMKIRSKLYNIILQSRYTKS